MNSTICTFFSYRDGIIKCDLREQYFDKRNYSIESTVNHFDSFVVKHNICNPLGVYLKWIYEDPNIIFYVVRP